MTYSEAQKKASRKYNEKNYERLYITVPKGLKARIEKTEKSINGYVNNLIMEDLQKKGL